jgi:DNA repair exonuclease SbcCD nuclease subunit
MRYLFVGDPHATVDALPECRRLIDLIKSTAVQYEVDVVCLLGDLYHTHASMRVEVMEFWREAFDKIGSWVYVLKGNHDMPNDGSKATSLNAHRGAPNVKLFTEPELVEHDDGANILFCPYIADKQQFLDEVTGKNVPFLICHQSFLGFRYENGTPIEDGVDFNSLRFSKIISGHIHSPQEIGKVWYPGAPRWRIASDANTERHIWVVDLHLDGTMTKVVGVPTSKDCSELICLEDRPENPLPDDLVFHNYARVMIDIHGPQDWIEKRKSRYPLAHRVRTYRTDNKVIRVKESEGIEKAFQSFLEQYTPKKGTDKKVLLKLVKERVWRSTTQ